MLVPFLIFAISLILIIGMLFYRVFQMREGLIQPEGGFKEERIWAHIETFRNSAAKHSKRLSHKLVLLLLRVWIKSRYSIKRKKQVLRSKIADLIHRSRIQKNNGPASKFLASIAEYKAKLKKMKEQVETEEMRNIKTAEPEQSSVHGTAKEQE